MIEAIENLPPFSCGLGVARKIRQVYDIPVMQPDSEQKVWYATRLRSAFHSLIFLLVNSCIFPDLEILWFYAVNVIAWKRGFKIRKAFLSVTASSNLTAGNCWKKKTEIRRISRGEKRPLKKEAFADATLVEKNHHMLDKRHLAKSRVRCTITA